MKVILSTDALPDQSIEELIHACQRRALEGLEVVLDSDQAHGLHEPKLSQASCAALRRVRREDISVEWFHGGRLGRGTSDWGRQAQRLGAGLVVADTGENPSGGRIAQLHESGDADVRRAVDWAEHHDRSTAWQVAIREVDAGVIDRVLGRTGERLAHIRLLGGGPEADELEGGATSHLFGSLAITGYQGTIAIAPSAPDRLDEWRDWLLDQRGWGCNTAAEKRAGTTDRLNV